MRKALLTTSVVIVSTLAVAFIAASVFTLSDTVLNSGTMVSQPKLTAELDDSNVNFETDDVDSLRPSLNVIYTNQYGQRISVLGYSLSASVLNDVCLVYINYNGLTTSVELDVNQR